MEFTFKAEVHLTLENNPGETMSKHVSTDFTLDIIGPLDKAMYISKEGMPTEAGSKAITLALVQGLVGNIHMAHEKGFRDSAEHLRYIISELERGFINVANIKRGKRKS